MSGLEDGGSELVELEKRVAELFELWEVRPRPCSVAWNHRLRTTAGRAFPGSGRIELNPHLLARCPDETNAVLAHEAAHLAVHWRHGGRCAPHGPQWRAMMAVAGYEPRVAHSIPVRRLRRRKFFYLHLCERCGHRHLASRARRAACAGCGPEPPLLVFRASRSPAGRRALLALTHEEARRRSPILS